MPREISQATYRAVFAVSGAPDFSEKQKKALEHALDIRKFEIQLYWTRATYFWTFIAAALAAYGAIQTMDDPIEQTNLSVFLSCIGFVLSFGWYCANRGSKQWQENWENHVDLLEDDVVGPLYKTMLKRPNPVNWAEEVKRVINGPAPFSVSKVNQIISVYTILFWSFLIFHSLPPFRTDAPFSGEYTFAISLALIASITIWKMGRTQAKDYDHVAVQREARILDPVLNANRNQSNNVMNRTLWYSVLLGLLLAAISGGVLVSGLLGGAQGQPEAVTQVVLLETFKVALAFSAVAAGGALLKGAVDQALEEQRQVRAGQLRRNEERQQAIRELVEIFSEFYVVRKLYHAALDNRGGLFPSDSAGYRKLRRDLLQRSVALEGRYGALKLSIINIYRLSPGDFGHKPEEELAARIQQEADEARRLRLRLDLLGEYYDGWRHALERGAHIRPASQVFALYEQILSALHSTAVVS